MGPRKFAKEKRRSPSSSSSSSRRVRRKERKMDKARRLVEREEPEYRKHLEEKARSKSRTDMEQQAEIFRAALAGTFDSLVSPKVPPPAFPPAPAGPALPRASGSADLVDPTKIAPTKARLIEAEFGHAFCFADRSISAVTEKLANHFKAKKHFATSDRVIKHYDKEAVVPRALRARAEMLIEVIQRQ